MTPRLRFLLSKAIPGHPLWDVACDHGLLGEGALFSGLFPEVHFVDPLQHRMRELQERLGSRWEKSELRFHVHAKAAQLVNDRIEGTVVIAGIGGDLMTEILRSWIETDLCRARRLVLSPHKDVEKIPEFLSGTGTWDLMERVPFDERGRNREIFVYESRGLSEDHFRV